MGLAFLADAELMVGGMEQARLRTRECLGFADELGFMEVISMGLDTSAALLAERGQAALAARLTGTAEALREEINVSQTPAERGLHRRTRETLRASLGDDVLGELRAEGRVLNAGEAVVNAVEVATADRPVVPWVIRVESRVLAYRRYRSSRTVSSIPVPRSIT